MPFYLFGHEKKADMAFTHLKFVPPGNYEFKTDALHLCHPKFFLGKEKCGVYPCQKTLGPGQYVFAKFIGKEGPKIAISEKYKYIGKPGNFIQVLDNMMKLTQINIDLKIQHIK